jgi:ABC-2 type transport system permease protein
VDFGSELRQYRALLHLQLVKVRQTWVFHLLMPCLVATGAVWLRSRVGFTADDRIGVERYACGAAVLAAIFSAVNASAHDMARATESGEVEYLATYPVRKSTVVVAYVTFPVCCSVPASLFTLLVSAWLLGLPAQLSGAGLLVLVLVSFMLGCMGIALGLYLQPRVATSLANLAPVLLTIFTPILFVPASMPGPLGAFGRALPTTVAVDVLRASTYGDFTAGDVVRTMALSAVAVVLLVIVSRLPGWRGAR